jgi:hypothetical protein
VQADLQIAEANKLATLSPVATRLFALIASGAKAYPPIGSASRSARLERLTTAGGWTEAALALVELELPHWRVRRLEYDGGEWHCLLSLYPSMPREFDDAVDGRDVLLPLAILDALLEARRRPDAGGNPSPQHSAERSEVAWCENTF